MQAKVSFSTQLPHHFNRMTSEHFNVVVTDGIQYTDTFQIAEMTHYNFLSRAIPTKWPKSNETSSLSYFLCFFFFLNVLPF